MKKLLLLLAVTGIAFFSSCEKEPPPAPTLTGTYWVADLGSLGTLELIFTTPSTVVLIMTAPEWEYPYIYRGTYIYNQPAITIDGISIIHTTHYYDPGTVNGDTMTIGILVGSIVSPVEFKKQ